MRMSDWSSDVCSSDLKDFELRVATLPQAARIYRLSVDYTELHVDPDVATHSGFSVPILHGLCSFGTALRSIVEGLNIDPADMKGAGEIGRASCRERECQYV